MPKNPCKGCNICKKTRPKSPCQATKSPSKTPAPKCPPAASPKTGPPTCPPPPPCVCPPPPAPPPKQTGSSTCDGCDCDGESGGIMSKIFTVSNIVYVGLTGACIYIYDQNQEFFRENFKKIQDKIDEYKKK